MYAVMNAQMTIPERLMAKFAYIGSVQQPNEKCLSRNAIFDRHIPLVLEEDLPTGGEVVSKSATNGLGIDRVKRYMINGLLLECHQRFGY